MPRSGGDTRANILNAAVELLEGGRGEEVRIGDIARRAGVSRQGLYLHFRTRAELLIAAVRHVDELRRIDERLAASRGARSGPEHLDAWIEAWGDYIPEIHGVARALLAMKDEDATAAAAWKDRMWTVREGCAAAVEALHAEGILTPAHTPQRATDILWTMLSVDNWEQLRGECGWSQATYLATLKSMARTVLLTETPDRPDTATLLPR